MIGDGLLLLIAGLGHLAIWVAIYNRLHATAVPRRPKKLLEKTIYGVVAGVGILLVWRFVLALAADASWLGPPAFRFDWASPWIVIELYILVCWCMAGLVTSRWLVWKGTLRRPDSFDVRPVSSIRFWQLPESEVLARAESLAPLPDETPSSDHNSPEKVRSLGREKGNAGLWCGDRLSRMLARVPANQILELEVNEKVIELPGLANDLDGLTIAHASDFHLTGRMTRLFYEHVVDQINQLDCDLIALTGDLIDHQRCLSWLQPLFGRLTADQGVFYVLGNHDRRIRDESLLRQHLADAGLIALNGQWELRQVGQAMLALAGNELPWYAGAETLAPDPPLAASERRATRLLLAHSPDQIGWAVERQFDLVLAGHTHGGQIRPPLVGPIVSPSRHGPKFASGEFVVSGTHMHVSRGVAGTHLIRLNCRPEITRIVLRRG